MVYFGHGDLFGNTKADLGACSDIHSEEFKLKYEESDQNSRYDAILERELLKYISDADKKIAVFFSGL